MELSLNSSLPNTTSVGSSGSRRAQAGFRKRFRALEQTGRATDPMSVCPPTGARHTKSGPLVEAGQMKPAPATCACCDALCVNVALFSCVEAISAFQAVTPKNVRGSLPPAAVQRAASVSSHSPRDRSGRRGGRLRSGLAIACLGIPERRRATEKETSLDEPGITHQGTE